MFVNTQYRYIMVYHIKLMLIFESLMILVVWYAERTVPNLTSFSKNFAYIVHSSTVFYSYFLYWLYQGGFGEDPLADEGPKSEEQIL